MKMEQRECSETSEYKIQTPENYPEESTKQLTVISFRVRNVNVYILNIYM